MSEQTSEHRLTVLVVEDDVMIRGLLNTGLTNRGFTVLTALGGHEALRTFEAKRPDLIVTDLMMPNGNGLELIAAVRAINKSTGIVVISGGGLLNGRDALTSARELGADAVLRKPFTMTELTSSLQKALARSQTSGAAS